jgi:hypothetical protein
MKIKIAKLQFNFVPKKCNTFVPKKCNTLQKCKIYLLNKVYFSDI